MKDKNNSKNKNALKDKNNLKNKNDSKDNATLNNEDTPNAADAAPPKKDFKSKWENYWYYYKYHTFAAIFVLIMVGMFIQDKCSQVHYDYKVALLTEQIVPEQVLDKLEKSLETYAVDLNKNGKVQVQILNYVTSAGQDINPQDEMANQTRLMGDMDAGDSMIYIYSDSAYDTYKKEGIFAVKDGQQTKLSECKGNKAKQLDDLNICMRVIKGTSLEKKKDEVTYYKESKALLKRFETGTPKK